MRPVMSHFWTFWLLLCVTGILGQAHAENGNESEIEPRIVGGTKAKEGQFPHQISLRLRGEHFCGGVIISSTHVITAAHCVKHGDSVVPADLWTVQAGSLLLSSGGVSIPVATVTVHPNYNRRGHDLAVLRLQSPLTFDPNIAAIQLASEDPPHGATVDISGWGQISQNGPFSNSLLFVQVTMLARQTCRRWYYPQLPETMICLLHPRDRGACFGDSGGPATYGGKVVGLASLLIGGGCGRAAPDGYERISQLRTWITEQAGL
ncbi:serine protease SP24D-like [Drosophila rhopaloa]|uniref:trypsin n=1 Tax=Drosophila rhopaloa TaxID=1041015 RepID=A0ABM5GWY8_DRORH|nr:serine protease SP24D-like [Drosophila rhopaloa]